MSNTNTPVATTATLTSLQQGKNQSASDFNASVMNLIKSTVEFPTKAVVTASSFGQTEVGKEKRVLHYASLRVADTRQYQALKDLGDEELLANCPTFKVKLASSDKSLEAVAKDYEGKTFTKAQLQSMDFLATFDNFQHIVGFDLKMKGNN